MSGDAGQPPYVIDCGARRGSAFRLDEDDVKEVSPFQTGSGMAMVLADGEQVNNAASLGFGLAPEVY